MTTGPSTPAEEPTTSNDYAQAAFRGSENYALYRIALDSRHPFGGQVLFTSPNFQALTGARDPQRFETWFENIHPDDAERAIAANQRALEDNIPYDETVRLYHRQKKTWVWLRTVSNPIIDENGQVRQFHGLVLDVTAEKEAEQALHERLSFKNLVTRISTQFINLPPPETDSGIFSSLKALGEYADVDRCAVFLFDIDGNFMNSIYEWCAPGVRPQAHKMQGKPVGILPWFTQQIKNREVVYVPNINRLPPAAEVDRAECKAQEILSLVLVPMIYLEYVIGFVGFYSGLSEHLWPEENITLLQIVSEIFVSALEKKWSHDALEESQRLLQQQAQERERELGALLDLSRELSLILEFEPKLDLILDQLHAVVEYSGASILILEGDTLGVVAYRGPIPQEQAVRIKFPLSAAEANRQVIEGRAPVLIPDVTEATPLALAFQQTAGEGLHSTFAYLRCWLGVPLIARDQVLGMLSLDHPTPGFYRHTPHATLALAFAHQVAAILENARLLNEVRQRGDEAQTLFAVQQAITSRLDPDTVLQMIANEARRLTNTDQGAVYLVEGDELVVAVVSGQVDPAMTGFRLPVAGSTAGSVLQTGRPAFVSDANTDEQVYRQFADRVGAKSFLIVPLLSKSGPIGTITVANQRTGALCRDDERVLTMLASGAVIALENARYYQAEQEQRREADRRRLAAEGLRDILAVLNSNRPLHEALDFTARQACQMLQASATLIHHQNGKEIQAAIQAGCEPPPGFNLQDLRPLGALIGQRGLPMEPLLITDLQTAIAASLSEAKLSLPFQTYLEIPLLIKGAASGSLCFYFMEAGEVAEEDMRLAVMLADQAALVIENAHLRAQMEQTAVAAERSRLARELHDAVTQTLFSASLIAEVLPRLWERNPPEGQRRLEELRQLTRGALAEMRTLLLELRPSALYEADLNELFRHLVDAFTSRARVPVQFQIEGKIELPPEVKVGLYRIAQEALNNIVKHAGASQVGVQITCGPGGLALHIQDDGRGFDETRVTAEHLGLCIMRERAQNIGAAFTVSSKIGKGTLISALWPAGSGAPEENANHE